MPKVTYNHPDGTQDVLNVPVGTSVMQAAIANGIDGIVAECGGSMMCATCHVYVDPGQLDRLPPISTIENDMLDQTASDRRPNSRPLWQTNSGAGRKTGPCCTEWSYRWLRSLLPWSRSCARRPAQA